MFARLDPAAVRALVDAHYMFELGALREKSSAVEAESKFSHAFVGTQLPAFVRPTVTECDSPADAALLPCIERGKIKVYVDHMKWMPLLLPRCTRVWMCTCPLSTVLEAARLFAKERATICVFMNALGIYSDEYLLFLATNHKQVCADARQIPKAELARFTWELRLPDGDLKAAWKHVLGM